MTRVSRLLALLLAAWVLVAGPVGAPGAWLPGAAMAQDATEEIDYEAWESTATRAENAVEAGRASTVALESLREELVTWRKRFDTARNANSSAIETVKGQLEALGPVPENGEESVEIAAQRTDLQRRLADLRAPVKTAELAHRRAEGLIKGIDEIIRDRQARELLQFGPSPTNPVHWKEALGTLRHTLLTVRDEVARALANPSQTTKFKENLPAVLILLAIGILLVLRGRIWSRRLTNRVLADHPGAGRWLAGFGLSLGSLLLPFLGVVALTEAIYASQLVGLRGDQMLSALVAPAFGFLLARWLSTRIFPAKEARSLPLCLDAGERYAGRWSGATLGLVAAGYFYVKSVSELAGWEDGASNVILFGFVVFAGVLLLRLSRLLRQHSAALARDVDEETFRCRVARVMALILGAVAVVAPLLAAIGYFTLAEFLMFPTLKSLLIVASVMVLQRLVTEIYVLVTRNEHGAVESLLPVLAGFILTVVSLPILALIWGARVADLSEMWTRFNDGVSIGETRISPSIFLTFAIVFVLGYVATRLMQGALKNSVLPKTRMDTGGRNAIVAGVGYVGILLSALIAITSAGIDLSSLAIVAGALSVGIGFGLQNIVSNFVSGIILLIERPISEGDWIEVGGQHGYVRSISVRSTRIETFDRTDVIVPNADFVSGTVTNYTRGNTVGRVIVPVGVAYGSDTRKVERVLQQIAEAHPMVLANPRPYVVFMGFGASSMDFEIRAILRDVNWVLNVKSDMNHEVARRFAEEGIEVPFAQRDIWIRNPEAFGAPSQADPENSPVATASVKARDIDPDAGEVGGDGGGDR
ncbi:DUF3772 domain-containing protein [Roseovarius sp. SYSU LYC5161]|uniref:DUF3772 domain-containing protein n=1 Tax=Roseovarius halophilus (ex Wu et al. 2025) TaxID=3376060 RepID=UPI00399A6D3C